MENCQADNRADQHVRWWIQNRRTGKRKAETACLNKVKKEKEKINNYGALRLFQFTEKMCNLQVISGSVDKTN